MVGLFFVITGTPFVSNFDKNWNAMFKLYFYMKYKLFFLDKKNVSTYKCVHMYLE